MNKTHCSRNVVKTGVESKLETKRLENALTVTESDTYPKTAGIKRMERAKSSIIRREQREQRNRHSHARRNSARIKLAFGA